MYVYFVVAICVSNVNQDGVDCKRSIAYVTGCSCFNQSEHSYGVRHGVNVRSFNQSERGYGVRHGAYVRCFNQSERGYGVYTSRCVRHEKKRLDRPL